MKREKKETVNQNHKVNSRLKKESIVFIQTNSLNVSCIHANVELGKLKLSRY